MSAEVGEPSIKLTMITADFCRSEIEQGLQSLSLSRNRTPGSRNVKGLDLDRVLTFWMKAMLISIANPYLVQARVTGSALNGYGADCSHLSLRITLGCVAKDSVDYRNFASQKSAEF